MAEHRRRVWLIVVGPIVLAIVLLAAFWDWDWFRPWVEGRASAALGRRVTLSHLSVRLGWHPVAVADNVTIANPEGFSEAPYFAHIDRLTITADARAYLHGRHIVLTRIALRHPDINAVQREDGRANWNLLLSGPSTTQIGDVVIIDGKAHVVVPRLHADLGLSIHTEEPSAGQPGRLVVDADGTYAKQRITGHATGGAVLSLRDATHPYPIDAAFENGPTKVTLTGTVRDPLHLAGTDLKLHLSGPDMALLYPLTAIPVPATPPYDITGQLAYADRKIRFSDFRGRFGSSDVEGTIAVDPTARPRPTVDADLASRRVDLADLGGFIGSQPGRLSTPGQTPSQRRAVARAEASPQLLPTVPLNLPKLTSVDVHLRYRGAHIEGRSVPFDTIATTLDITGGRITVHPLTLGIGRGDMVGNIDLQPVEHGEFRTKAHVTFERLDVARMLAATHLVHGAGLLGGEADLESTGNSVSSLVGHGDGQLKLLLAGGNVSALMIDLSGLELGKAVLAALGIPTRTQLQCLAVDMTLRDGVLQTRTFVIDTNEADVLAHGSIELARERLDLEIRTLSRHFTVGSLPTPIRVGGTFKHPSIAPEAGPLAARAGAAVGLGVLLTPLGALLPTVQFGTGRENLNRCEGVVHYDERMLPAAAVPPRAPVRH